jgi:hypothetical protein
MKKFKIKQDLKKDKKDDKPKVEIRKPVVSDNWKAYEPEVETQDEKLDLDVNKLDINDDTSGAEANFNVLLEQSSKIM